MTPDPRLIEREISRMRERETGAASGARTSLFTLLILRAGPEQGDGDHVEYALRHLAGRRPARLITITPTAAERTEASVSGRCSAGAAGYSADRAVCLEEVDILAGRDGVGADPGAWSPLLLRGLPVFVWLPDGLPPDAPGPWESALAAAAGLIDGLIVDSSRAPRAEAPLRGIARLCRAVAFPVVDFSWRRGRVLREQSARAFDPPEMRPLLSAVSGVELFGGSPAEAGLFFRWVAERLSRALRTAHAAPGALADGFAVRFTMEGAPEVEIGCTRGGCLSRAGVADGYRAPSDGEMLLEAVDGMSADPLFQAAVTGAPPGGTAP